MALIDSFSKEELEQIVKDSSSIKEVVEKLGYSATSGNNSNTVKSRINQYNIDCSHFHYKPSIKRDENTIFIKDSTASQQTLRRWYKKGNYSPYVCSICRQKPMWMGKELTLILDHINGNNHDDRLENLRWVCPNCNQQLETTGFKVMRVKNRLAEIPLSRDELKSLIKEEPFTSIGKRFGVSDKYIREWCDKYNLPRTKKEINSYSDIEWESI